MSQPDGSSTHAISSFNIPSSRSQQPNLSAPARSRALRPNNNNNSSTSSLFVRRLIVAIVLLFVFVSVVNFIAWRILHPLPPVFEVNSFHISISDDSAPKSIRPNTGYNIVFAITNPNKKLSLLLDHFEVLVFQGKRKTTASREWMPIGESVCLNKNIPMDFHVHGMVLKHISFLRNEREVNFNVQVNLRTRFLAKLVVQEGTHGGYCRDLNVRFLSEKKTGNFTGEKGKCSVQVV